MVAFDADARHAAWREALAFRGRDERYRISLG
jgi:hypothetical protein